MSTENANVADHAWETSKENVKPIKTGRKVKGLQLRGGPDGQMSLQSQADNYEEELKAAGDNDDPLATWIRYLAWIRQSYPSDSSKSMLLLERCTEHFKTTEKYKNDTRYVKLWIEYADLVPTPGEIFAFLQSNKIGEKVALFWIAWAFVAEKHENFTLTDKIFQKGINKRAEPRDTLQHRYQQFQRRMARFYLNQSNAAAETGAASEPLVPVDSSRKALSKLSRSQASSTTGNRAHTSTVQQPSGLPTSGRQAGNAVGFDIFSDSGQAETSSSAVAAAAQMTENKHWTKLASQEAVRKENDAPIERFADTAPIGSAVTARRGGPSVRPEDIFVDPAFEQDSLNYFESDDEHPEPSVRKKLDSHVLTTHSALSEQEKLLKDPLAKHKQGDGVIVPVPPLKQSSSSSRDADRPHRPVDENLAARDHRATPISALVESSGVQLKAASKVTRPVEPFVLFEDKCHSSQSTSANKSVARPASNGSFALIDDISRNDTFQSKPAAKAAAASVETFSIFEDTSSVNEKTRIAPARSIKKSSITGFDIFCDGSISSKKDSSKVKSVTVPEIVPAFANIEKGKKNTAASNEIGVNRSALKPKRSAGAFDDFDDHEVAYDDTTINTKIAKMDIDAMFFDVEDSDPMPTSRPLDLNMSSSVVFPVTGSIIDARNQLEQPAIKKDGGFVIFDEYSVIKSDSIHRSHDVSAESPFSNYDTSPLLPSGAPSARNYKKRTLSAESDDLRESSTAKARRQGSSSELPVNSLYLSASSDSINGELDSMQYSMQPTRPLKPKDPKSSNSLSFKLGSPLHNHHYQSVRPRPDITILSSSSIIDTQRSNESVGNNVVAEPNNKQHYDAPTDQLRRWLEPSSLSSITLLRPPVQLITLPSVIDHSAEQRSLTPQMRSKNLFLQKKRKFFSPKRNVKDGAGSSNKFLSIRNLEPVMCMDSLHALIATTRAPPQGKGSKDNPVHNSSRIVPTAKMLLERLANNVRNVGLSMRSDCSTVSSEYPDFDQKSATSSCIRTYTSLCKPNTECSLPAKSSNKWEVIRGQYSKSNYISNLVEIRSILREAKTSGIIPELLVHESVNLPKYMGGEQGFFYEKSFVFAVVKRAVLSRDHWADIHSFVGSGTFGYVLLARKSSFQGNDPQSPKQIVLKIDHKKQFVVWEVFIHAKYKQLVSRMDSTQSTQDQYCLSLVLPTALIVYKEASVLVMPYCDIGDLVFCANYLNAMYTGLSHEQLNALLALQMLKAVQFIHSKNILHRDIKLNNWVIRISNSCICGINIALIDFGKAIDVADYLEIQPRSTLREHVYTADLMGLLDTQQCLLFGKNAESVEVLKSMMPSAGKKWKGYDIHMAISALDSVQNTQIADKFPCIQIFIPSRPLKKFWSCYVWSTLFVPILSHCTLQNDCQKYLTFLISNFNNFLATFELSNLQKIAKNFINGLSRYHNELISK